MIRLKIPPSRLPEPPFPPTKPVKIGEVVKDHEFKKYLELQEFTREHSDRGRANNKRARPYTPEEDEIIMRMLAEGATCTAIGMAIGRQPGGIKQHIKAIRKRGIK